MASIDRRLDKLEHEAKGLYEVLQLPDGTKIRYEAGDLLEAFLACMDRREHWLVPHVRRMSTREGFAGLINALESSRTRVEGGGGDEV
jgi:hypothetical protein